MRKLTSFLYNKDGIEILYDPLRGIGVYKDGKEIKDSDSVYEVLAQAFGRENQTRLRILNSRPLNTLGFQ